MIIVYAADKDVPQAREIAGARPALWRNPAHWKGEVEGCKSVVIVGNWPAIAEAYRAAAVDVETHDSQFKSRALKSIEEIVSDWAEVKANIASTRRWSKPAKHASLTGIQRCFLAYHEHDQGSGNALAAALSMSEDGHDLPALAEKEPAEVLEILIVESRQPEPVPAPKPEPAADPDPPDSADSEPEAAD